jgi:hypothetical protein
MPVPQVTCNSCTECREDLGTLSNVNIKIVWIRSRGIADVCGKLDVEVEGKIDGLIYSFYRI